FPPHARKRPIPSASWFSERFENGERCCATRGEASAIPRWNNWNRARPLRVSASMPEERHSTSTPSRAWRHGWTLEREGVTTSVKRPTVTGGRQVSALLLGLGLALACETPSPTPTSPGAQAEFGVFFG